MQTHALPPALHALLRTREAALEQACLAWRQAQERLQEKDQEVAALQAQLSGLDQELRQRAAPAASVSGEAGAARISQHEFRRLVSGWKPMMQLQLEEAAQQRQALHSECERLRTELIACRVALRTLERYCERQQSLAMQANTRELQREVDDQWLGRKRRGHTAALKEVSRWN